MKSNNNTLLKWALERVDNRVDFDMGARYVW